MKKILLLLFFTLSLNILSKDIYVGDLITLKLRGVNKSQIIQAFNSEDINLENISGEKDEYVIQLRPFKTGKLSFNLGNSKLTLDVKSTITSEDKEIYPHLSDKSDLNLFSVKFPYLSLISILMILGSIIFLIKKIQLKERKKIVTPEDRFETIISTLSENNWQFELSMAIREYIDNKYKTHFINGFYTEIGILDKNDILFLENLDKNKFSIYKNLNKEESIEKIKSIYNKLKEEK